MAHALTHCRGKFVCFLDDDDMWLPDKLETVAFLFFTNPELSFLAHDAYVRDDSKCAITHLLKGYGSDIILESSFNKASGLEIFMTKNLYYNSSSIAIRRSLINEWKEDLSRIEGAVDLFYFFCAVMSNCKIAFLHKPLSIFRIHDKNNSRISVISDKLAFSDDWKRYNIRALQEHLFLIANTSNPILRIHLWRKYWYYNLRLLMYENGKRRQKVYALIKYVSLHSYKHLNFYFLFSIVLSILSPLFLLKVSTYRNKVLMTAN